MSYMIEMRVWGEWCAFRYAGSKENARQALAYWRNRSSYAYKLRAIRTQ